MAAFAAVLGSLVTTSSALAEAPHPYDFEINQSFLSNTQIGAQGEDGETRDIQNKIYGTSLTRKMTMEYQDLNRDYEMRMNYGLTNSFSQQDQYNRNSAFGRYVMRNVFTYQVDENLKKAEKSSEEGRTIKHTHDAIQNIVKNSTKFDLGQNFKFGTKTDLPSQRGQIWMHSDLFNADLNGVMGHAFSLSPQAETSSTSAVQADHLYMNVSRDLGVLGLKSAMSYGFESTRMNHSVSKQVLPNLNAEVATTRGLDAGKSGMNKSEESLRMTYGLRF